MLNANRQELINVLIANAQNKIKVTKYKAQRAKRQGDTQLLLELERTLRHARANIFDVKQSIIATISDENTPIENIDLAQWCVIYPSYKKHIERLKALL